MCARSKEGASNPDRTLLCRQVKWDKAESVPCVGICTASQQSLSTFKVVVERRVVQLRPTLTVNAIMHGLIMAADG